MPNNYLSVLHKHIIQVENKNVGLKGCVCVCVCVCVCACTNIPFPLNQISRGACVILAPPPPPLPTPVNNNKLYAHYFSSEKLEIKTSLLH